MQLVRVGPQTRTGLAARWPVWLVLERLGGAKGGKRQIMTLIPMRGIVEPKQVPQIVFGD